MDEIGVFTPEQARLLWQDFQRRRQLQPQLQANFPQRRLIDEPSPHRVFLKNTTAETIPAYACCEIVGTEDSGNITALSVVKPSSIDGHFIFNGSYPIAAGETGWGYRHGVVLMLGDEPATVGEAYQPIVDSWEIEAAEGGPFTVFGRDRTSDRTLVGRFAGGGGGGGSQYFWFTVVDRICGDGDDDDDDPYTPVVPGLIVEATIFSSLQPHIPVRLDGYYLVQDPNNMMGPYNYAQTSSGNKGKASLGYPVDGGGPIWILDWLEIYPDCGSGAI
jgi:hypothetical protein